jgi:hypothetical protein
VEGYESVIVDLLTTNPLQYALTALPYAVVTIKDAPTTEPPLVKEVHPLKDDFASGKDGRIFISAMRDHVYYTVKKTTADNKVAQTRDGKVVISAYLEKPVAGVKVYFDVVDPDDPARYSNVKGFVSDKEDLDPTTVYDFKKQDHNIEKPTSDKDPGDNRDSKKTMEASSFEQYKAFQENALSARWATTVVREIGDGPEKRKVAVAEVTLTTTNRFNGDNYIVRATTADPRDKKETIQAFNYDYFTNIRRIRFNQADIPAEKIKQTTLLTAWQRVYYELDVMYRVGAAVAADAAAGQRKVKVRAGVFKVGDKVRVMDDRDNREPALATVMQVQGAGGGLEELTLDRDLTRLWKARDPAQHSWVGKETGNAATDFYIPDTSRLPDTFDDTFVEIVKLNQGSTGIPLYYPPRIRFALHWSLSFFSVKAKQRQNLFQLVGAGPSRDELGVPLGFAGSSDSLDENFSWVFVVDDKGKARDPRVLRDIVNHEAVHQFDETEDARQGEPAGGHNKLDAHDGSDKCLMNVGVAGLGGHDREDDRYELSLDRIYQIRDRKGPI